MSSMLSGELGSVIVDVRPLPRCYLPRRFFHAVLLIFGVISAYLLRTVLSVAIVPIAKANGWDKSTQGLILSSYYWGYAVASLPSAYLIHKFGVKIMISCGLLLSALVTVAFPFLVPRIPYLVALRIVLGIGEAVTLPGVMKFVATWFPKKEQSSATAFLIAGTSVGVVLALALSPLMALLGDWRPLFFLAASFQFVWLAFWLLLYSERPDATPLIKPLKVHPIEVALIESERDEEMLKKRFGLFRGDLSGAVPWVTLLTHRAVVALLVSHFCHMYGNYLFQSWLPTILVTHLGYSVGASGLIADIPYFLSPFILFFSGVFVDLLSNRTNTLSLQNSRKLFNGLGQVLPAITLLVLGFAHPSRLVATILVLTSATSTAFSGGLSGNYIDLSPKYSSIIFAYVNTVGTIPGFAGVYLTGAILDWTNDSWSVIFIIGASLFCFSTVFYTIFGQARRIDFDGLHTRPCASACTGMAELAPWEHVVQESERLINSES